MNQREEPLEEEEEISETEEGFIIPPMRNAPFEIGHFEIQPFDAKEPMEQIPFIITPF